MQEPVFSERLVTRRRLWWDPPLPWRGRPLGEAAHWLRERRAIRSREDPEEAWRCCAFWQRTLVNKWNAREYAARHGCDLPRLYWRGMPLSRPPIESLPDHFVVRPFWGTGRRGILVVAEGRELLRQRPAGAAELRRCLSRRRRAARWMPILIEELVESEDGGRRLPVELKCHTFGDSVAAIEVLERKGVSADSSRWYTPGWEPFADPMHTWIPPAEIRDPPDGVEQMVALAAKIGLAIGTYMRIDFFASKGRCVFNEFSATPWGGGGYSAYCDRLFGSIWEQKCAEAT